MELVDTHAHLYSQEFEKDIAQVLLRCRTQRVCKVYMPNIDTSTVLDMLALEAQYPDQCAAMIGIHPCYIDHSFQKKLEQVDVWLGKRSFAAIGEIGIDLYRDTVYRTQQIEALTVQLSWAQQYQLPVVIHCRGGMRDTLELLEKYQDGTLRGIFHCFSGSLREARSIIDLGFYLGIGGIVTFKNAGLDKTVAAIGLEHLVLETDAPYLSPTPYRGQRNEPVYLWHIAEKIAAIKAVDVATVARLTTENAMQVFKNTRL